MNAKLLVVLAALFLAGCVTSTYDKAYSQLERGRYAAAVENYDHFIRISKNGADRTVAELERSEAYYQLGQVSYEKGRLLLAARFYYLANSLEADQELDRCYFELGTQAREKGDYEKMNHYYDLVLDNLPSSEFTPEILFWRIKYAIEEENDSRTAWDNYRQLYDRYPSDPWVDKARVIMDPYIEMFIDEAVAIWFEEGYEQALDRLFLLEQYPSSHKGRIYREISDLYLGLAEQMVTEEDYIEAERTFRAAIDYDPQKRDFVEKRLQDICHLFIRKGNELREQRKIEQALQLYAKTFEIIPNYQPAFDEIEATLAFKARIEEAAQLLQQAETAEMDKNWSDALDLYRRANELDPQDTLREKIFLMTNMVLIEKDPRAFAYKIVSDYKNGKILREISQLENKLLSIYGDDLDSSGWRFMVSVGDYRYEARYDIITLDKSYFFGWLVNMRDRTLSPLNKASEDIME